MRADIQSNAEAGHSADAENCAPHSIHPKDAAWLCHFRPKEEEKEDIHLDDQHNTRIDLAKKDGEGCEYKLPSTLS
jgi:hypothetical protein